MSTGDHRRNLASPFARSVIIVVRALCHDNRAHVPGLKIHARSTTSPEEAARKAALKVFGQTPFEVDCLQEPDVMKGIPGRYSAHELGKDRP